MLGFSGIPSAYTPQVVVNGRDRRRPPVPPPADHQVALQLQAADGHLRAEVQSLSATDLPLIGYWAATENGLSTAVGAGENAGVVLQHDFVVRDYRKLRPFTLRAGQHLILEYEGRLDPRREVALVLALADSARPVQALRWKPGC
jgi:hypothetical protein